MLDADGKLIRLGNRIAIGGGMNGVVVFSIDTDEYSPEFPKDDWSYLGCGIMVQTEQAGLVHLSDGGEDTRVIDQISN